MHIAIVYSLPTRRIQGTPYVETDSDSALIAQKVALAVEYLGHSYEIIGIDEDQIESVLNIKADLVFNLVEWCGLDIGLSQRVFANLAKLKIPVTGSGENLFVLSGDKARLKQELIKHGFPTPRGIIFKTGLELIDSAINYPVLVKPSLEHCSAGLSYDSIAQNETELRQKVQKQLNVFEQPIIAEEFVQGRELLVYLVMERGKVRVLPIEEVVFSNQNPLAFQTYESKWVVDHPDYQTSRVVLAKLSPKEQEIVENTSITTFETLGFGGYARFDVRLKNGIPYMLETNANPSVYDGDGSLSDPTEEVIPGIRFCDYIGNIIASAQVL